VRCSPVNLDGTVANAVGLDRGRSGAIDALYGLYLALRGLYLPLRGLGALGPLRGLYLALRGLHLSLRGLGALGTLRWLCLSLRGLGAIAARSSIGALCPLRTLSPLLLSTLLTGLGPLRTLLASTFAIVAAGALRQCGARGRHRGRCRQNGKKDLTHYIPRICKVSAALLPQPL
jgi:hypothetical protein